MANRAWNKTRVGVVSSIRRGIPAEYVDTGGILILNQKCVRPGGTIDQSHAKRHGSATDFLLREGDVLINSTGTGTLGRSALVSAKENGATADSHTTRVRPQDTVVPRFLAYVIAMSEKRLIEQSQGSTNQIELSARTVGDLPLYLPDLGTQREIADYLDRETAEIDRMTTTLDALVELLGEHRAAVIDHGVREAGPYAPLHVAVERSQTGPFGTQLSASQYVTSGIPIVNPSHMKNGRIAPSENETITSDSYARFGRFHLQSGDLILGRKGDVSKSVIVTEQDLPALCGSDSLFLRPNSRLVDSKYLWWWFNSPEAREYLTVNAVGSTLTGLNQRVMQATRVPLPPLDEQRRIADHLDAETAKIDTMVEKANHLRDLLAERRSALITATVTGNNTAYRKEAKE